MDLTSIYLAPVFGAIGYAMVDYIGAVGNDVFKKKYLITTMVNMMLGVILVMAFDMKPGIHIVNGIDVDRVFALVFGISGQKIFKTLADMGDKKVKTKLGLND